jgi:hypothetical protein
VAVVDSRLEATLQVATDDSGQEVASILEIIQLQDLVPMTKDPVGMAVLHARQWLEEQCGSTLGWPSTSLGRLLLGATCQSRRL